MRIRPESASRPPYPFHFVFRLAKKAASAEHKKLESGYRSRDAAWATRLSSESTRRAGRRGGGMTTRAGIWSKKAAAGLAVARDGQPRRRTGGAGETGDLFASAVACRLHEVCERRPCADGRRSGPLCESSSTLRVQVDPCPAAAEALRRRWFHSRAPMAPSRPRQRMCGCQAARAL
jgi:hypothetical protein